MADTIGMVLCILVAMSIVVGAAQAAPTGCDSAPRLFAELGTKTKLEKEIRINGMHIEATAKELAAAAGKAEDAKTLSVLRYAIENATQHGIEDMYFPELARLKLEVIESAGATEIRITNDLHKKFPDRLARTFAPGEQVELSIQDRPFPRGMGMGLPQIFRSFADFPAGSQMSWNPQGSRSVTFRLRFPH